MATATRPGPGPGSGADQETESGDDFILATPTVINSATFIGLLPTGLSSSDIVQVRVEIYRVFPNDSDAGRTPNVPTRANSPSDVEFADRDSASGNLTVDDVTVLNSSFTAANSVDTGIHPFPNQTTLGDGPVTAQEIEIGVTFTTPFTLPADHYFFVPQVLLSNASAHFLWLSAPKPTSPPFTGDLQEWIRNADLDPDWLRVAMDIVGAPPAFNASFSLAGDATRTRMEFPTHWMNVRVPLKVPSSMPMDAASPNWRPAAVQLQAARGRIMGRTFPRSRTRPKRSWSKA